MAATPLNPTARYIPAGVRQYYWVKTIANKAAPTRSELDAGTDLTAEINAVDGFTTSSDSVDAPDLGTRFTSKVPGRITADDSSLTVYLDENADEDIRSVLARDDEGFVVQFPEGDDETTGTTHLMDVFPVKVASVTIQTGTDDPGTAQVTFTITSEPANNVPVPAAV